MKTILFVCTGNTCRSPMAVGLLKDALKHKSNLNIISAGVIAPNGMNASANAVNVMREINININDHRTQPVTKELIDKSDLIFVMTQIHKLEVVNFLDKPGKEVYLLKEFNNDADPYDMDIPDPIGKSLNVYRYCRDEIAKCMAGIIKKIG